ncbi:MAG: glycosyltransferase family 2 protein [Phycisphaeraceae bacterium]|nr:glycosyltransferase family 2 protein [Phycisphaeraceae bacterium]
MKRRVTAIVVTWNRADAVIGVLGALSRQRVPEEFALDVIVVDNASTDGTSERLKRDGWVDGVLRNDAQAAHEPRFVREHSVAGRGHGAAGSVVVVRNATNFGGCGGFNTGMLAAEHLGAPTFLWLVDDDVDLPEDALGQLLTAMDSDGRIGLVGSRTCDIDARDRTIESTIYLDRERGVMCDEPPPGHRLHSSHVAWAQDTGGPKGRGPYSGVREVDVVSACSMLARWRAVEDVGLWDKRYFLYCDDADWCLRMAQNGWRVVLNLDAVVYHTPWHQKLTPARAYYAQRNLLWMLAKIEPLSEAQRVTGARIRALLDESLRHALGGRIDHAEILLRACEDAATGRDGPLALDAPKRANPTALAGGGCVGVFVSREEHWAESAALRRGFGGRWIECVKNVVPHAHEAAPDGVKRIVYSRRRRSRLRRALGLWIRPPRVLVQFDREGDLPVVRHAWSVQMAPGSEVGEIEKGGVLRLVKFWRRWRAARRRCLAWADRLTPPPRQDRFG